MAEQIQFSSAFMVLDDFLKLLLHIAHIDQGFGEFIVDISKALELSQETKKKRRKKKKMRIALS